MVDLQVSKALRKESEEIAEAISKYIKDIEEHWGFALFLVDYDSGVVQYISDVNSEDCLKMLQLWINRTKQ